MGEAVKEEKKRKMPKFLKVVLWVLGIILGIVLLYAAYVFGTYDRIEDNQALTPEGSAKLDTVPVGEVQTIFSQNIGFCAYVQDYTFFMDGGTESRARSKESVHDCLNKASATAASFDPDFILYQEVDIDSTRSYHVPQMQLLKERFEGFDSINAINYHSAYLMVPPLEPHGASNSGILTLAKYDITSGLRRSYPISEGLSKVIDLDRCFSKARMKTSNGKELVLYNSHLSAYGGSDEIHSNQLKLLLGDMKEEYDAGNYVIVGGDFNDDFTNNSLKILDGLDESPFGWTQPFPKDLLPEGIHRCIDYADENLIPTARNCDVPYVEGNFTVVVDGFIVSDNVECVKVNNIQTNFEYSDHNPVVMDFVLK